jgi:hypothetical protein
MEIAHGLLDVAGFLEGTLKSSSWVDILCHYERHFAEFRNLDIEVLEIGVHTGSSLAIWKQYFKRARFIGVDIEPACRRFADDRVNIEIGSQDDPEFLFHLTKKYNPSIIIDDGSHLGHHIPFTFERLFPSLPPGGIYVIEDMFFHLLPQPNWWLGYSKTTSPDYLFDVVRLLFTENPDPSVNYGIQRYLRSNIEEISFAPLGVAFIRKKTTLAPLEERMSFGQTYAKGVDRADVWLRLAQYIQRNNGPPQHVEEAAMQAIKKAPNWAPCYQVLASARQSLGDFRTAIEAAQRATELDANTWTNWDLLGQLCFSTRDFSKAEDSFKRAIALHDLPELHKRLAQAQSAQSG